MAEIKLEDFGEIGELPTLIPGLKDHYLLPVLVQTISEFYSAKAISLPSEIAKSLVKVICEGKRPAIFRDIADSILQSASLLEDLGSDFAMKVLDLAKPPLSSASPIESLLAADALEVATELRIRQYCERWDLYALLSSYDATTGPLSDQNYPRAVLRSILSCVEYWPEADDFVKVLKQITGMEVASPEGHNWFSPLNDSDSGIVLSKIEMLRAFRSQDREQVLTHLKNASRYLRPARSENRQRADINAWDGVLTLLTQLITSGRVEDLDIIDSIREDARELIHLDPRRYHWLGNRVAAVNQAWTQFSTQLNFAQNQFLEPSWYRAAETIHSIVNFYRVSSSTTMFCRAEDGKSLHKIIAPILEGGFADSTALLKHLQDHVAELKFKIETSGLNQDDSNELQAAEQLLANVLARFTLDQDEYPKLKIVNQNAMGEETPVKSDRILAAVNRRMAVENFSLGSLVADDAYEKIRAGFSCSPDYVDRVAEATDLVAGLLVRFVWDRNQLGESDVPYLYDQTAIEEDLATDLHNFLRASGSLGSITTEIRRVGGGRVDIQFGFPGFNLYVELKVDSTKIPLKDKQAYLRQAASYTVVDQRISFLVVLRLVSEKKMVPPHFSNAIEVISISDSDGKSRHVGVFELAGARTKPSSM
ncbi:hypothetical protein N24_1702 [Corynebacterium suranareeae]|uniref:Uncharacterized protein n=1 Tax=Corynebacterium suranareeae TaxID=2506452 RepID=A0A160PQV9_9CORY|nr:hypothetical protein [Corynebacterium suranareeae]BAU95964.1 hypothetical protein N24_1702 [Corynebacterium suranareeae]